MASGVYAAGDRIDTYMIGRTGFLTVNQKTVISLKAGFKGLTVAQRLKIVAARLKRLSFKERRFEPENIKIVFDHSKAWLEYRGNLIVYADPITARSYRTAPGELAGLWRENLLSTLKICSEPFKVKRSFTGIASWYGKGFSGRKTANGEAFNEFRYTAAHRTLPFGTRVRITNLRNQASIIVVINDRGPWIKGRVIDLSWAAARAIGNKGLAMVRIEVLY